MATARKIPARLVKAMVAANVPETLSPGRKFLVIGPHVWGKGDTVAEAYGNARVEGDGVEKQMLLYDVPANARVDDMGYTTWTWEKEEEKPEPDRELLRYGVKAKK